MNFSRNRTNLQSQEALQSLHNRINMPCFEPFYTATVAAIVHRCDHAKQMAAVSDSLGKKFTTIQSNWCGHLMRIGKKVIAL